MKITVYIINTILFMGCCLLVSTTIPEVKDINVNNKITYVNSDAIKKEEVIEIAPVEVVLEEPVLQEKIEEEKTVVEETPKVVEGPKEDVVIGKDEEIDYEIPKDEEVYIPPITVGSVFNGTMSGYGSDIGDLTASEYNISKTIYYEDSTYGTLRILASDGCIPFGTVIEVSNSKVGNFKAIVLDRGGNIGFDRLYDFDLLFETSVEAMNYGSSLNATFKILRVGY